MTARNMKKHRRGDPAARELRQRILECHDHLKGLGRRTRVLEEPMSRAAQLVLGKNQQRYGGPSFYRPIIYTQG